MTSLSIRCSEGIFIWVGRDASGIIMPPLRGARQELRLFDGALTKVRHIMNGRLAAVTFVTAFF